MRYFCNMKIWFLGLTIMVLFGMCKQPVNNKATNPGIIDTTVFFHVNEYIRSQIEEVVQTPYYIYKIEIFNGKKNSSAINNILFKQAAMHFIEQDINQPQIKNKYTENIFHDQSTQSFTLSYTTNDPAMELKSVDVLLQEDGETVKRIFMRKFKNYADSTAIEQLSWKANEQISNQQTCTNGR